MIDEKIENILPQKEPFRFIKDIIDINKAKNEITCLNTFRSNEFYFKGHFPKNPIVPGVLIIEAMAQASLLLIANKNEEKSPFGYLAKVESCSFLKVVKPDMPCIIKCRIIKELIGFIYIESTVYFDQIKVSKANLVIKIVDNE